MATSKAGPAAPENSPFTEANGNGRHAPGNNGSISFEEEALKSRWECHP